MWEFLVGVFRGLMEWFGKDRKSFWDWFILRLLELYGNIRYDIIK